MTLSPIAIEVVRRIDALFDIERSINGKPAEGRRAVRQELSKPLVEALQIYMREQRAKLSRGHDLAKAIDYILKRWPPSPCSSTTGVCVYRTMPLNVLCVASRSRVIVHPLFKYLEHWKLNAGTNVTRAPFTPGRLHHRQSRPGRRHGSGTARPEQPARREGYRP